ncbi:MAG: hypothetical protein U1E38_00365 [Rhodospirillales bacterium]
MVAREFGWGPEQNGWLFAFIGLVSAGVQGGLVSRLAHRFGEPRLISAGARLLALGMLAIPMAGQPLLLWPAMLVVALGFFSLMTPSLNSMVSLSVEAGVQERDDGCPAARRTLARVQGRALPGSCSNFSAATGRSSPAP